MAASSQDLVKELSHLEGYTVSGAKRTIDEIAQIMADMLKRGVPVKIPGVGVIKPVTRAPRKVISPLGGEHQLPERKGVRFKPSIELTREL